MYYRQLLTKVQLLNFWRKPSFILALILGAFFLKGIFMAALSPIFVGQDESRHYNSLQFIAEPKPVTWPIFERKEPKEDTFQKFNYTQEIKETARAVGYDEASANLYSTTSFIKGYAGKNEAEINANTWNKYNENYPVNSAGKSIYHRMASVIEKLFSSQSILFRYFLARIFSVFLGTIMILTSYFIAKNIGFSSKSSLLLATITAFQPRLSIYYSAINYDALLILVFTLFTLGGVLALKNGLNWKNLALLIISVLLGIFTKATAAILLIALAIILAFFTYEKIKKMNKNIKYLTFFISLFAIIFLSIFLRRYFPKGPYELEKIIASIGKYLSESLTIGRFALSSRTYWGTLTWVNNWFLENSTNIIWVIETFSAIGIAVFLFFKKRLGFLPEKKYILFLLAMVTLLQFGIRFADWIFFYQTGDIETGTPGRYFLPNITAHIILVFTGIGALLRKKEWFEKSLVVGLILMMTFMLYIIFDVIIFRYYL